MHARVIRVSPLQRVDDGLRLVRSRILPVVQRQPGYLSVSLSRDPDAGSGVVVSLWETPAALAASDAALGSARSEMAEAFGVDTMATATYDAHFVAGEKPVTEGCWLRGVRFDGSVRPEDRFWFRPESVSDLRALPGLRAVLMLSDLKTGAGAFSIVWDGLASLERHDDASRRWLEEAAAAHGLGDLHTSRREVLLVDVPE